MRDQQTLDGIVLRTYDIGEADRLCIVLTRERGRMAMRARAVRKLGSKMGALLLPGRRLMLDVRFSDAGETVVAAKANGETADLSDPLPFATVSQGIELLLLLTEDDEPLPAVFDVLHQFLHVCSVDPAHARLPFQLRLFHLLGLLPSHQADRRFMALDETERTFVRMCSTSGDFVALCAAAPSTSGLNEFVEALLEEHVRRTLKSSAVLSSMSA